MSSWHPSISFHFLSLCKGRFRYSGKGIVFSFLCQNKVSYEDNLGLMKEKFYFALRSIEFWLLQLPYLGHLYQTFNTLKSYIVWIQGTWGTISPQYYPHQQREHVRISSAKEFWLVGFRRKAFSTMAPALWNILPYEMRLAPSLLMFQKSLKTWFCQMAWGLNGGASYCKWLIKT